jgi:hypothetical protein
MMLITVFLESFSLDAISLRLVPSGQSHGTIDLVLPVPTPLLPRHEL